VEGEVLISDYQLPLTSNFVLGGEQMALSPEDLGKAGQALKISYLVPATTALGINHAVPVGALAGVRELRLRARSEHAVTFIMALQENSKQQAGEDVTEQPNYSAVVTLDAGAPWRDVVVPVSSFALNEGAVDPDGELNMAHVDGIMLLDISVMQGGQDHQNTLWLQSFVGQK
jgi:hypothetical protein